MYLQELVKKLEAIRLQYGGSLEVSVETDGVNIRRLDTIATPTDDNDKDRIVVLSSLEQSVPDDSLWGV